MGNFSQERVKQIRADLKTLYDKVKAQKADSDKDAMITVRCCNADHGSFVADTATFVFPVVFRQ